MNLSGEHINVDLRGATHGVGPERSQDRAEFIRLPDQLLFLVPKSDRYWPVLFHLPDGRLLYGRSTGDGFQAFSCGVDPVALIEMSAEDAQLRCEIERIPFPPRPAEGFLLSGTHPDAVPPARVDEQAAVSGISGSVSAKRLGAFHNVIDLSGKLAEVNLRGADYWCAPDRPDFLPTLFRLRDGCMFYGRFTARGWLPFRHRPAGIECTLEQITAEDALLLAEKEAIPFTSESANGCAPRIEPNTDQRTGSSGRGKDDSPSNEQGRPPVEAKNAPKEPVEWEMEAYKLWEKGIWRQREIARMLSEQFHKPIDQSMVSRAKKKVENWTGGTAPRTVSKEKAPRRQNADPMKLQHTVADVGCPISEQALPLRNRLNKQRLNRD
jgi:hypothetical protein